jgi:hypothetical protein
MKRRELIALVIAAPPTSPPGAHAQQGDQRS